MDNQYNAFYNLIEGYICAMKATNLPVQHKKLPIQYKYKTIPNDQYTSYILLSTTYATPDVGLK